VLGGYLDRDKKFQPHPVNHDLDRDYNHVSTRSKKLINEALRSTLMPKAVVETTPGSMFDEKTPFFQLIPQ
jgi:hypothetical protein